MIVVGLSLKWSTFFFFFFLWVIHDVYTSQIKRKDDLDSSSYIDSMRV